MWSLVKHQKSLRSVPKSSFSGHFKQPISGFLFLSETCCYSAWTTWGLRNLKKLIKKFSAQFYFCVESKALQARAVTSNEHFSVSLRHRCVVTSTRNQTNHQKSWQRGRDRPRKLDCCTAAEELQFTAIKNVLTNNIIENFQDLRCQILMQFC